VGWRRRVRTAGVNPPQPSDAIRAIRAIRAVGAMRAVGTLAVLAALAACGPRPGGVDRAVAEVDRLAAAATPQPAPGAAFAAGTAPPAGSAASSAEEQRAALRRAVAAEPGNGRAWALLGFAEAEAGRFAEAAQAFERALATSRKVALDPWVWCEYADVLGMAQGTLAGKPTEAIAEALRLQPNHPKALEMAGSAAYERSDFAAAASYWKRLLPQLDEGEPPHQAVRAAIGRAERRAAAALPPAR
jgi:cytochrome c-type biogenesis protein CcmH/NrfG